MFLDICDRIPVNGDDLDRKQEMSVIVVGAGVSGLVAATKLLKVGFSVTMLEAGDYIDGRVKTGSLSRLLAN